MALTIAIEGKQVIANCDAINDTAGGSWSEQGGGTISLSEDVFLIGTACISGKYAGKDGFHQYDLGGGNELDFTASTGTEAGQCIYIWISMTALGTLDTLSTFPLCIRVSSDAPGTSNYVDYLIAGNDDKNGWAGGFKCFVIDPTKTGSRVSGTQSTIIASVRTLGIWIDCSGSARADSIFIDQISVGSGLRITGTSTTAWSDTVEYCTAYATRGWGMFQEREGIYYAYGKMYIGDETSQSAAVSFADQGKIIQFGTSEYYQGGEWKSSVSIDFSGLIIEDHADHTTTFTDGVIVGSDNGRAGTVFAGNSFMNVSFDLYGSNNLASLTALYGTQFKDCTGILNSGDDSDHKFLGVSFAGCSQFDPVGAPVIRNAIFAETSDPDSALLWNETINIQNTKFISNTIGAAIEIPFVSGTDFEYDFIDLSFSGNDPYDVYNSTANDIIVNNIGSNASTYVGDTGSIVTFVTDPVTTTITVKNVNTQAIIEGARVLVVVADDSNFPYQDSVTIVSSGTTATVTHTAHGLITDNEILIAGANEDPYNSATTITVTGDDTYTYTMLEDPDSPATGTITATMVIIDDSTNGSGIVTDTRTLSTSQPITGRVRSATSSPYYKNSPISSTIDSDAGVSITILLIPDE